MYSYLETALFCCNFNDAPFFPGIFFTYINNGIKWKPTQNTTQVKRAPEMLAENSIVIIT